MVSFSRVAQITHWKQLCNAKLTWGIDLTSKQQHNTWNLILTTHNTLLNTFWSFLLPWCFGNIMKTCHFVNGFNVFLIALLIKQLSRLKTIITLAVRCNPFIKCWISCNNFNADSHLVFSDCLQGFIWIWVLCKFLIFDFLPCQTCHRSSQSVCSLFDSHLLNTKDLSTHDWSHLSSQSSYYWFNFAYLQLVS